MRIDRKFAPITITLEQEEDLHFLREVVMAAKNHEASKRFLAICGSFSETSFQQKLNYFMGQLK